MAPVLCVYISYTANTRKSDAYIGIRTTNQKATQEGIMDIQELDRGLREVLTINPDEVWTLHLGRSLRWEGEDVVATFTIVEWDSCVEEAESKGRDRLIDDVVVQEIWIKKRHFQDPRFWTVLEAAAPLLERAMNGIPRELNSPHHLLKPVWSVLDLKTPKEVWEFKKFLSTEGRLGKWL